MAKISVIVPVYKVEPYLRKCVDSILNQTFRDFELILVDDGSPDNCGKICDEYAVADGRVKVIHQQNGGLSAARNAGIDWVFANSDSEYITFIDSDDWVDVDYIECLSEGIGLGADVSCTSFARVYKTGKMDRGFPDRGWKIFAPEDYWVRVDSAKDVSVAKLYAKKLFAGIRFPVGKINEDMFTTYRVVFSAKKIACRDVSTYKYLKRDGSITTSAEYARNLTVVEGLEAQCEYFCKNCYSRAADYAFGRVLSWKLYTSKLIKSFDLRRSEELREQVARSLSGRHLSFWRNRDVFRQTDRFKFVLFWPFAMLWNAMAYRKDSWLIREALPLFKRLLLERLDG